MRCPSCNGQRYKAPDVPCGRCGGNGVIEPMTNEQWLHTLTTEQLAEYLASTFDLCGAGCHHCFLANVCLTKAKNENCLTQEQMIVEWLKQPHSEVEK